MRLWSLLRTDKNLLLSGTFYKTGMLMVRPPLTLFTQCLAHRRYSVKAINLTVCFAIQIITKKYNRPKQTHPELLETQLKCPEYPRRDNSTCKP